MRYNIFLAAWFLITSHVISAQSIETLGNKRFIEITGLGETEVTPDLIYITITLQERPENREKLTIDKQEENLKQNLRELGIPLENLTVSSANVDYGQYRTFKKDVIISKTYLLKINNAEKLSLVYERLDKINAFDAYVSKVDHSRIIELTKENRIKAIKASRDKAEYLLSALGQTVGPPLQVFERENYVDNPYLRKNGRLEKNVMNTMTMSAGEDSGAGLSFSTMKIHSSYMVRYEIINK